MDGTSTPRTARDALIIELMGDIGRLDDGIKALPNTMNEAIAPTLGALVTASKEAEKTIAKLGAEQKSSIHNFAEKEKSTLRESLKAVLREEAGNALASAAGKLAWAARVHNDAVKQERAQRWLWLGISFFLGLCSATYTVWAIDKYYGGQFNKQAAYGRAVYSAWSSLDAKTQKRILAAMEER